MVVLIDMEQKECELIIHDHDLWVNMVGWVDVPGSDQSDFNHGVLLTYLVNAAFSSGWCLEISNVSLTIGFL